MVTTSAVYHCSQRSSSSHVVQKSVEEQQVFHVTVRPNKALRVGLADFTMKDESCY